jgi:hypothetical protein
MVYNKHTFLGVFMKTCKECGIEKPMTEYYAHKEMADGHLNKCKSCVRSRVSRHMILNADYYKEYDKKRANLPHRVEARKAYLKTESGKLARKKAHQNYKENYPLRKAATIIVNNAVRDGRLEKQPCLMCGDIAQAHHPDYSRPLDVVWLCVKHHNEAHAITKELLC